MQCLIVDDDQLICDLLGHFCDKVEEIRDVTTTNSGFESINLINRNVFDLVFLDYNLPDVTGEEILSLIPNDTAVVMITAHKEFAAEAFSHEKIVDYLVKPFDFARFFRSVQQAEKYLSRKSVEQSQLFVRDGTKLVKIDLSSVLLFKAEANYVAIVTLERRILTLMTLKELVKRLPKSFQRVHRSYVVNLHKIDTIEVGLVKISEHDVPVSSTYEKKLLSKIKLLN
ncbi:MAG: response regulator transcription factor [Saprospiraceae bacterium]|nr:response regulator transcription factor [Saprospiraceae bacterium]